METLRLDHITGRLIIVDIAEHNRRAWNREVSKGNIWTRPVDAETVAKAKRDQWDVVLTPTRPVPRSWFGALKNSDLLCLACGGGQQGPIFAAAGAKVTVFDNSPSQLDQDRMVAARDQLQITTIQGDMRDLSAFADASFDIIFHPVSNVFVDNVNPVWQECFRVLRPGGTLLAGICNPLVYIFDLKAWDERHELVVKNKIPYADTEQLPPDELEKRIAAQETLEFGHTLEDQIGGQLQAGFVLTGFFEDTSGGDLLDPHLPTFIATRAVKPKPGQYGPASGSEVV